MEFNMQLILRILSCVIGALLIACGIVRLCYAGQLNFIQVLLSLYYILFAVIIILSEFLAFIANLFSFQLTLFGRGGFMIFIGILCFDIVTSVTTVPEKMSLATGIIVLIFAIFLIVYGVIATKRTGSSATEPPKV